MRSYSEKEENGVLIFTINGKLTNADYTDQDIGILAKIKKQVEANKTLRVICILDGDFGWKGNAIENEGILYDEIKNAKGRAIVDGNALIRIAFSIVRHGFLKDLEFKHFSIKDRKLAEEWVNN